MTAGVRGGTIGLMRARTLSVFVMALLFSPLGSAQAEEAKPQPDHPRAQCPICQFTTDKASYGQKAGGTLLRGATNVAFGWTELLVKPREEVKEGGNVVSGIGKGVSLAIGRSVSGLGELLTFWTPKGRNGYLRFSGDCPVCMGRYGPPPGANTPTPTGNTVGTKDKPVSP